MEVLQQAIGQLGDLQASYDAVLNEIWNRNWNHQHPPLELDSYRLVSQLRLGGAQPCSLKEFTCVVRILTVPMPITMKDEDDDSSTNRSTSASASAIQYAAQCGRHEMVRNYLGLLVLSCLVSRRRRHAKNKNANINIHSLDLTFEGWLDYLGYPSGFFDKDAFRLCVKQSWNEETKQVLISNTYSLETLVKTTRNIMGAGREWPFDVDSLLKGTVVATKTTLTTKTKTARPLLRVDDLSREDPHILLQIHDAAAAEDMIFSEHPTRNQKEQEKQKMSAEEETNSSHSYHHHGDWEDAASSSVVDELQMTPDVTPDDCYFFDDDDDDHAHAPVENTRWVEILNLEERKNDIATDWSILSEVSSVVSFERSMVLSFKEILVLGDSGTNKDHASCTAPPVREAQQPYGNDPKLLPVLVVPALPEKLCNKKKVYHQDNESDTHQDGMDGMDAHFIMEGFKGARGGRFSSMFKGNSKKSGWPSRKHHGRLERKLTYRTHTSRFMI